MKRIAVFVLFLLLFALPVSAEDNDIYTEQYSLSGADELDGALPDDTRNFLNNNGIDPSDYNWVSNLTKESVFGHIKDFLLGGAKMPLRSGATILGIILITAAVTALGSFEGALAPAMYASAVAVAAVIASPVWAAVSSAVDAAQGSGTFMLSFVPVFASIVALSGGTVTSVSMSALLLGAAEVVVSVASFAVLPLMGGFLGMSVCSAVSPLINNSGVIGGIKKISLWVLSLVTTLFTGILSIQTAVNSAADSLSLKTARFIIGTSVPVAGSALSEAVSTVTASVSLLRSSVGIYGVVALAAILLPIVVELVMWRMVCTLCSSVSDMLALPKISGLLRAVDTMLSVLVGVILLTAAMFIIALTVVIGAVKT